MTEEFKRKLTAIMSADVAGYSRLMSKDEVATVQRITTYRELIAIRVREHNGRVVASPGDNLLAEFPSALDAIRCAIEVQRVLKTKNDDFPVDRKMEFRIGIHLGDVLVDGERIYGDGVNIAARLESLAEAGGISISGAVYDQVKNKLHFRYEDQGKQSIKNINEPIQVYYVLMESETIQKETVELKIEQDEFKLPEGPSIAVLPFVNLSGDASQEYICDGLTENIITSLSYNPKLFVIARNSCFHFKGKSSKVQEVAKELGVSYILEGSFQKAGERVRINAQLIEANTGHHLWAEKYDREFKDLFELQDEMSEKIFTSLAEKLTDGERANIYSKYPTTFDTKLKLMKAYSYLSRVNKDNYKLARQEAKQLLALTSNHPGPYLILAWTHLWDLYLELSEPQSDSITKAIKYAKSAIDIDEKYPDPYCLMSWISLERGNYQKAIDLAKRAIFLNPNYSYAYYQLVTNP